MLRIVYPWLKLCWPPSRLIIIIMRLSEASGGYHGYGVIHTIHPQLILSNTTWKIYWPGNHTMECIWSITTKHPERLLLSGQMHHTSIRLTVGHGRTGMWAQGWHYCSYEISITNPSLPPSLASNSYGQLPDQAKIFQHWWEVIMNYRLQIYWKSRAVLD